MFSPMSIAYWPGRVYRLSHITSKILEHGRIELCRAYGYECNNMREQPSVENLAGEMAMFFKELLEAVSLFDGRVPLIPEILTVDVVCMRTVNKTVDVQVGIPYYNISLTIKVPVLYPSSIKVFEVKTIKSSYKPTAKMLMEIERKLKYYERLETYYQVEYYLVFVHYDERRPNVIMRLYKLMRRT